MRAAVRVPVEGYGSWWLWVVTYDTREELKAAAEQYYGYPLPDMSVNEEDGILGCFTDNKLRTKYLGIMRLFDTSCDTVIHESVHAAIAMANREHGSSHLSGVKEEAIAYATPAIAGAVMKVLHD